MTEQIQDQISAFVDDELSTQECEFFVRRLQRDRDAVHRTMRFATIGAALRGELLHPDPGLLLRRIDAALTGAVNAPVAAGRARPTARASVLRPAVGIGIAASVAVASLVVLRTLAVGGVEPATMQAVQPAVANQWIEPASYVVPQEAGERPLVSQPIRLTNYLMHHGAYASRLGRTMVHSNVVVTTQPVTDDEFAADAEDATAAAREPAE